jgi:hypothetical protein
MTPTKSQVQSFYPLTEPRYFNQYRITIKLEHGYQGQIIFNDIDKDINLAEWNEWGCHSAFHDTVIEKACPGYEQCSITIKHIELLASYEY